MSVSVLVSYRPGNRERDRIWNWVEARWRAFFPEYELVVSSDDGDDEDDFNQGQAYNRAARMASGDIYLITCPDVAFNPEGVLEAVERCAETGDWLVPEIYHQLRRGDTRSLLRRRPTVRLVKPHRTIRSWYGESVAEVAVVPAGAYHFVGGYDERYPRWGWIDKVFAVTMNTLYRPFQRYDAAMYHLWHTRPRVLPDSNSLLTKYYLNAEGSRREVERLQKIA